MGHSLGVPCLSWPVRVRVLGSAGVCVCGGVVAAAAHLPLSSDSSHSSTDLRFFEGMGVCMWRSEKMSGVLATQLVTM